MLDSLTIGQMLIAVGSHASWHSLVKSATDNIATRAGMGLVAGLVTACCLPFLPVPPRTP